MATLKFSALKAEYKELWDNAEVRPRWSAAIDRRARRILANKPRYEAVEARTGVPWPVVGVIHSMEGGLDFRTHLHNGDSLRRRTRRVPRGRPRRGAPPFTWEESADDALRYDSLHLVKVWSPARICYALERFNGFGYRKYHKSVLSPYLWSGTTYYRRGKYTSDGTWSNRAVSQQTGAIPLLHRMAELDPSIVFGTQHQPVPTLPVPKPALKPEVVVASSRKLTLLQHISAFSKWALAGVAGFSFMDVVGVAKEWTQHAKDLALEFTIPVVVVGLLGALAISRYITKKSIEDNQAGRYTPSGAPTVAAG